MSVNSNLLKLIFPEGYPLEWEYDNNFNDYISKLGSYKVEDLVKEPSRLRDEKTHILEQTQEMAVTNYKTFIETAQCSRELFTQFDSIETHLDSLLEKLPGFEEKCNIFCEKTSGISTERKLNSLCLTKSAQLLEILELPQLMDSFISDGMYEDALELASYVRKLYTKHPDIPIFKRINDDVDKSWLLMLHQLLTQLRSDIALPKCLQIVSHLRRMEIFTEAELRIKFLQTRNAWLQTCLKTIPTDDVNHHIAKTIEVTRVSLFSIITQYRAVFNDDDHSPLISSVNGQDINKSLIFNSWIKDKITEFLKVLEEDLMRGVSSIESVIGQCMYFGLSFSKVGCDFRDLLIPIFSNVIRNNFKDAVFKAKQKFEKNIECFTLINKNHPSVPWRSKNEDPLHPPNSLLEFYPLADYLNNILTAFNELRMCAPIAVISDVVKELQNSLIFIANSILVLYAQEQQAFTPNSKDAFTRLCMCFADDLVPYLQKCVHIIFPPTQIASLIGTNVQYLQNNSITILDKSVIVEPIRHLLPPKIEPVIAEDVPTPTQTEDSDVVKESVEEYGDNKNELTM